MTSLHWPSPKPYPRTKNYGFMLYTTEAELKPILSQISLPWQQGSVVLEFD